MKKDEASEHGFVDGHGIAAISCTRSVGSTTVLSGEVPVTSTEVTNAGANTWSRQCVTLFRPNETPDCAFGPVGEKVGDTTRVIPLGYGR